MCNVYVFNRGRVRGGATYTTASSNDIDRGTPAVGYVKLACNFFLQLTSYFLNTHVNKRIYFNRRTRPTLKPSTSIVSKASEFVDVYKYAPTR